VQQIITAGQVVTSPAQPPFADSGVLLDGPTVTGVGGRDELRAAAGGDVAVHDFPQATLLPGLINAHVHLAFGAELGVIDTLADTSDEELLEQMTVRAQTLLSCGVTTIRDMADRGGLAVRLRDQVTAGEVLAPRILAATAPLTPPGGHCWFLGGEVEGIEDVAEKVRANADAGADLIKVMVSGGGLTPGGAAMHESQFGVEFLRAVVTEAHALGLPVAAHAHSPTAIADAAAAGVDTIEHCLWMTENRGFEPDDAVIAEIAAKGIAVCPADSGDWRRFAHRMGEAKAKLYYGRAVALHEAGVTVIAGTDAGVFPFDEFPDVLARFRTDWGFSPAEVLAMATTDAARALGLEGVAGVLVPGASADCLVVDGDPLTDMGALRNVDLVVAGGRHLVPDREARHRSVYTGVGAAR